MWPFTSTGAKTPTKQSVPIFFTNTLTGKKELFHSLKPGIATMYSCGPTVYSRAHIGNMRAYVLSDLISRTLRESGYHLRQVINITDVGHLVGDADEGEDKVEKRGHAARLSAPDIAARENTQILYVIMFLCVVARGFLWGGRGWGGPPLLDFVLTLIGIADQ
ncbi:MAG: hypothetical protein P4M11_01285, partial [Candidatus Pacebacteria bacterium]|nr:hypothetical protein [Candidatus Paceibacterota bacterium]